MKILGEANYRALARNNPINEVLLRGDPNKFLKLPWQNFLSKIFSLPVFPFTSILDLTKNKDDLIKITSQKR